MSDDNVPLCEIARETGSVPLSCLFECLRNCKTPEYKPTGDACCKRCGSTDVRWRQQGGKWVLFSLQPGVVHQCPDRVASPDEFPDA